MTVNASSINVALEGLADRTAVLVPDVQQFTAGGTWTKPALAKWIRIVLVGQGGNGGVAGGALGGGGGGGAGEIVSVTLPAALVPATLTIAGLTSALASITGTGFLLQAAAGSTGTGAGSGGAGGVGGSGNRGVQGADGGGGGSFTGVSPAANGKCGAGGGAPGAGGVGGGSPTFGAPGLGYGAGCGGIPGTGTLGGGGGGGGGYGTAALASGAFSPAPGVAEITTFRGI